MSDQTIFFSYSRDDSEFVLTLAKNLRKAGANIWLDQLDIKPGTRWDKSIETALEESKTLLVILSKSSVASTNVMDEVSYALEEKKTVVPVLLEDCDIPFRLRRLQFADFTSDQNKGLKTLAEALHLDGSVANKLTDSSLENIELSQKEVEEGKRIKQEVEAKKSEVIETVKKSAEPVAKAVTEPISTPTNPKSKLPLIIGGAIVVIAIVGFLLKDTIFPDKDKQAWEMAMEKDTQTEYDFYIRTNPNGKFLLAAKDSITSKEEQAITNADNKAWAEAGAKNTVDAYNKYLKDFSRGIHIVEANSRIQKLETYALEVTKDKNAWEAAEADGSVNVLASYITNSNVLRNFKDEAIAKINEVGKEGWLYYGKKNGDKMDNEDFDLDYRVGENVEKDMIPQAGDILVVKKGFRTYNRVGATQAEGATGRAVKVGKKVLLIDTEERGSAIFAKVKHD